jgi:hypothetical protein
MAAQLNYSDRPIPGSTIQAPDARPITPYPARSSKRVMNIAPDNNFTDNLPKGSRARSMNPSSTRSGRSQYTTDKTIQWNFHDPCCWWKNPAESDIESSLDKEEDSGALHDENEKEHLENDGNRLLPITSLCAGLQDFVTCKECSQSGTNDSTVTFTCKQVGIGASLHAVCSHDESHNT